MSIVSNNQNKNTLGQKTAVVTGAASGIGKRVAEELNSQGYRLVLVDLNADGLMKLSEKFRNCLIKVVDLLNDSEVEALCTELESFPGELSSFR